MKKFFWVTVIVLLMCTGTFGHTKAEAATIEHQMREMSLQAYNSGMNTTVDKTWKPYKFYSDRTSLQMKVYRKYFGGNYYDYVFAFRGTQETLDYVIDVAQVVASMKGLQVGSATTQVEKILKEEKSNVNRVYFTGHSLGGYIAAWMGSQTVDGRISNLSKYNMKTYTFNAPGVALPVSPILSASQYVSMGSKILNDTKGKYDSYIYNYQIKFDPISLWGNNLGTVKTYNNPTKNNSHKLSNFANLKF